MTNTIPVPPAKLQLPVEVIGADLYGQQFFEPTHTVSIHRNGVSILLTNKLGPDTEVIVRNPENSKEAIAFVVGQIPDGKNGHIYGLAFVDGSANLWGMQFPPAEEARTVQLVCSGCHSVCVASISDIELEIFEAARELTRSCSTCNSYMTWKATAHGAVQKKSSTSSGRGPAPKAAGSPVVSPSEERRKNRRAGMRTTACVRFSGMESVVPCEDISKGGFRFTSRKEFPQGTRVEAAVPYTQSSTNIFTPASIIYCHKMPDGQFRHGVSYNKNRKSTGWDS